MSGLEAEHADFDVPEHALVAGEKLARLLDRITLQWYADFRAAGFSTYGIEPLQDRWIDLLCSFPSTVESWVARAFLAWGKHVLPNIIAQLFDGEAARILDQEFADFACHSDEYQLDAKIHRLQHRIALLDEDAAPDVPHRPIRPEQKNCKPRSLPQQTVTRLLADQENGHQKIYEVRYCRRRCLMTLLLR